MTFLIPTIRLRALHLEDPVDQQERVSVGDHVQDPADVHRHASVALSGTGEPSGQRDVALVARLGRDHVRLHPAADERQVAQNVRRLVADELVGPAQLAADQARRRRARGWSRARRPGRGPRDRSASASWRNPKVRAPASSRPKASGVMS